MKKEEDRHWMIPDYNYHMMKNSQWLYDMYHELQSVFYAWQY
jgi:hypothetical protein